MSIWVTTWASRRCTSPRERVAARVAELLLEEGAEVDATSSYGNTPLFVAFFDLDPFAVGTSRRRIR
jgi:hypothetical protein